jgi:translation initiation factor RLI1
MFSRDKMKKSESTIKAIDEFISGAESNESVRHSKNKQDKKKPASFSATDKELRSLQELVKKYNSLAYENSTQEINRSDFIMAMKSHFEAMNDKDFYNLVIKIIT